jgi:hypothetical protein
MAVQVETKTVYRLAWMQVFFPESSILRYLRNGRGKKIIIPLLQLLERPLKFKKVLTH